MDDSPSELHFLFGTDDHQDISTLQLEILNRALNAHAIVAITDPRGVITYVNDTFLKISKYSREELIGKTHKVVNSRYHPKEFFQTMWSTISSGLIWRGEIRNRAKDGSYYWVLTTILPVRDKHGKICNYIAMRSDITQQKDLETSLDSQVKERTKELQTINEALTLDVLKREEVENQLRQHQEKVVLAGKMAALGEMAGGMAHEINNPLAIIGVLIEQLMEAAEEGSLEPSRLSSDLRTIHNTVGRIAKIVQALREFAQLDQTDDIGKVSSNILIERVLSLVRSKCADRNIQLILEAPQSKLYIRCSARQIAHVLYSLLMNSYEAIAHHTGEKWIKIELLTLSSSTLKVTITDSGTGIPANVREKLFQPFFTTKKVGSGLGLGLSTSRGLVELNQGTLTLNEKCPNTQFILTLPLDNSGH